jgi:protease I
MSTAQQSLAGKTIAVLMTDGVEQIEFTAPRDFLRQHGARVELLSPKAAGAQVQGVIHDRKGDRFKVDKTVGEARAADYDGLLLPGGVANPDALRTSAAALAFVRAFAATDRPIAAMCHGPWTLIDAGVVAARHVTSWPSLQTDLRNAGAEWTDDEVVIDGRLITSRKPDDLPAFSRAFHDALTAREEVDTGPTS